MKKSAPKKVVVVKTKAMKPKPVAKGKPAMAAKKIEKPIRTIPLAEVKVTATRLKKAPEEMVRLSPFGEAKKRAVDSLKNVGYGKMIGEPYRRGPMERATYGPDASDVIKKALKMPSTRKRQ